MFYSTSGKGRFKMIRLNCWEFKKCGIGERSYTNTNEEVCTAPAEDKFDSMNHGKNGGRVCWLIKQMAAARKDKGFGMMHCCRCDFFNLVAKQEGSNFFVYM